jgi:bifunctional protein TilS/HprT
VVEADMEKRNGSYYQAIRQITRTANSDLTLQKALNSIAKSASHAMDAAGCTLLLLSPQKEYLTLLASYGLSDFFLKKGVLDVNKSLPEVMDGKLVYISDIATDKRTQYPDAARMENIKSIIGVPVIVKGEIIGELRIYIQESRKISTYDKDFLWSVSGIISMLLEKQELHHLLVDVNGQSLQSYAAIKDASKLSKLPSSRLRAAKFGHPSEEQFARLLDFYRIEWLYEPRSFPIAWGNDKVVEMFTPDFYLPELNLYIELTTLKQSLITEKNRKIRMLKELYPDVNIKLLNKSDYIKMLVKYGYAPVNPEKVEGIGHVLFNHTQIQHRVRILAKTISKDYAGKQLILIGVLKGVVCFLSDLMRSISIPVTIEFMGISYYGKDPYQTVKITKDLDINIEGADILMVEDIVDTGMTLNYVLNHLASFKPASLKVCTLLDKRVRRLADVPLDYIGFEIPDEFIVGYGLDYREQYRNLPFIGVLNPKIVEES